jgi:hypothetical protein
VRCIYGPLSSYWIFYPDNGSESSANRSGELAYWNDCDDFGRLVAVAQQGGFGGVFTWNANADAVDWRVHMHIHDRLQSRVSSVAPPKPKCPSYCPSKNAIELQRRIIEKSIADGTTSLPVPSGDYHFGNTGLVIHRAHDFALHASRRWARVCQSLVRDM